MLPKPPWLRRRLSLGPSMIALERDLVDRELHTVCQEAHCPNRGECFNRKVATFLILGRICTRNCSFCAVTHGRPAPVDRGEAERLAEQVADLGLKFVVITSVTRDDLPDGGAGHFAEVVFSLRRHCPEVGIELLVPDFQGDSTAIATVVRSRPDVLAHNLETVPRLYPQIRPQAIYRRSLDLLAAAKEMDAAIITKSGLMMGLGESRVEVEAVLTDLRQVGVDSITLGQYLSPGPEHHAVIEYLHPDVFENYKEIALNAGFSGVASGPFVRSSYLAEEVYQQAIGIGR